MESDEACESPAHEDDRSGEEARRHARDIVTRLLASRPRSAEELRQALLRKEVDAEVAEAVLAQFVDAGLIDDAAFADSWVRSRQRNKGLGRRALAQELRRKGVSEEHTEAALSDVDDEAEAERARELVRKRLRSMGSVDDTARTRRLVALLARKGYSENLALRVVRDELASAAESGEGDS